ncbi:hypothetical protein K4F52_009839 [Lecanicillium sp. MT-2017a]|nr:hypothetical protein K4F52_009839 [Lecanicillium sp. MT-2017a]
MFAPTKSRSIQKLFAGFHQPAGISKAQSKKLLNGLKSSFRQHLDREHGNTTIGDSQTPGPTSAATSAKPLKTEPADTSSPTGRHLASILDNPLFKLSKTVSHSAQAPAAHSIAAVNAAKLEEDPMDFFDRAVERGMMNLKAASGCLFAKQKQLRILHPDKTKRLPSQDVAARVVAWLRSTDMESSLRFMRGHVFCRALVPFLVEEGMEQAIWGWLNRAMQRVSAGDADEYMRSDASYWLTALVRTKRQPPHGDLDAAIATLLQAEQLFSGHPHVYKLLVDPWRSVSWVSTVKSFNQAPASEVFFNAHLAAAKRLPRPLLVETAHLHLFHPTQPDFKPAFDIFSDQNRLRKIVHDAHTNPRTRSPIDFSDPVPWIAYLGYDTVTHLAKLGKTKEANGVTELLRHELSDLIQLPATEPLLAA